MRCSRNGRAADVKKSVVLRLVVAASLAAGVAAAQSGSAARGGASSSDNLRMQDTSIEGERQTPDIFFVLPTGKGGNLSAPNRRDYTFEILSPVVKPWHEREETLNRTLARADDGTQRFDWNAALAAPPSAAAAPGTLGPASQDAALAEPPIEPVRVREMPDLPAAARSYPEAAAPAAAEEPEPVASAPEESSGSWFGGMLGGASEPEPEAPAAPQGPTYPVVGHTADGVPILGPSQ